MAWDIIYAASPFAVSIWVKVVAKWFLRPVVKAAISGIPGGEIRGFDDEGVVEVIARYVSHAEQKMLVIFSYFSSIAAGAVLGLREGFVHGAVLGGIALVTLGVFLHGFLQAREMGTLDEPLRGTSGMTASSFIFLGTIAVDIILMVLAILAAAQKSPPIPSAAGT